MTSSLLSARGAAAKATAVHARASADFAAKLEQTRAVLRQAAALGAPGAVTQASSLGAEDVVITHLINALALDIPVFVLDTGALHTETLALLERTQAHSRAPIVVYKPAFDGVIEFVRQNGQDAMYRSIELRKQCCHIRKMEPLARALAGKQGWITGLRREQSNARAEVPLVDTAEVASKGLTKFNPLADWTLGDVWHYIAENQVDYNPLHDQFFPSIGCAPCRTRLPGSPACAASSPTPAPTSTCATTARCPPASPSSSAPWPTGPGATCGTTSPKIRWITTRCTTAFSPALAANPAPAPSAWARTSAQDAGGGKARARRNAVCMSNRIHWPKARQRRKAMQALSLRRRLMPPQAA